MGNLTAKLKGLNYKELLIDHAEKFGLGIVALLAVLCALGARWAGYDRTPEEMRELVDKGRTHILDATGNLLHDVPLPNPGSNGNGNGAPAAPAVFDLDGDGELEIFVQTFDHGMDVFTVPGSADNCSLWPTARGGPLRTGRPSTFP